MSSLSIYQRGWIVVKLEKRRFREHNMHLFMSEAEKFSFSKGSSCWISKKKYDKDEDFPTAALNAFYTHISCRISQDVLSCWLYLLNAFLFFFCFPHTFFSSFIRRFFKSLCISLLSVKWVWCDITDSFLQDQAQKREGVREELELWGGENMCCTYANMRKLF
jgi:hypothetical protein